MNKPVFIIHAGIHKTGTKSIQDAFYENRRELRKRGICFFNMHKVHCQPLTMLFRDPVPLDYQYGLLLDSPDKVERYKKENSRQLETALRETANCKKVLLSGEDFSTFEEVELERMLNHFADYASGFKAVIYLRDPLGFANSYARQLVHSGYCTIEEVIDDPPVVDYRFRLEKFFNVFGRDNVDVRIFDKRTFAEGSLIADFCEAIGEPKETEELLGDSYSHKAQPLETLLLFDQLNKQNKLIKDGRLNYGRARGTWEWFSDVAGVPFSLPLSSQLTVMERVKGDLAWLRKTLGYEVFADKQPKEKSSAPEWSGETIKGIALDLNRMFLRDQARIHYLEAKLSLIEGDLDAAKEKFGTAFAMSPATYDALWNYLSLLIKSETPGNVEMFIKSTIESHSDDPVILRLCAEFLIYLEKYESALELLERSVGIAETSGHTFHFMARAHFHLNALDKAEEAARKSVEFESGLAHFHRLFGHILYRNGKMDEAIEAMEKAVDSGDSSGFGFFVISKAHYESGKSDSALAAAKKAVELEPKNEQYSKWLDSILTD